MLKIEIITPERVVYSSEAEGATIESVVLPGTLGEIGVLSGHLPLMTTLDSGRVLIQQSDGTSVRMAIHDGFAQILPNAINILTDQAELASEIDTDRARAALEAAEKQLQDELSHARVDQPDAMGMHSAALKRARARLFVSEEDKQK
jgi:F-type H+-transporting ATPase subunit epsilon